MRRMIRGMKNDMSTTTTSTKAPGDEGGYRVEFLNAVPMRELRNDFAPAQATKVTSPRGVQLGRGWDKRTDLNSDVNLRLFAVLSEDELSRTDAHNILTARGFGAWWCRQDQHSILGTNHQAFGRYCNTKTPCFWRSVQCLPSILHKADGRQTGSENRSHVSGPLGAK